MSHLAQSVWRHVLAVGLGPAYMERKDLWDYVRKLLVLSFVPSTQIALCSGTLRNVQTQNL
ncbi:hypothetical protein DPMN_016884 [Dreissena polymorpha]|uniref:Uncharacterized protein n=1 Tax=Dreissena polymorpha TaxID=45954 RepID=A0A9D4S5W4_DREPO|nr:hypothetical protein DPMN_016884 [Dreissena polymorpha]